MPTVAPTVPPPSTLPAPPPVTSDTPPTPATPPAAVSDAPTTAAPGSLPSSSAAVVGAIAPSAVDALDVVDDFRRAYEQRNVERLGALFAIDAHKGALVGRDTILADYQRFFANARDLLYSQPSAAVEPRGDHVIVRAPFEITYKDAAGRQIEVRGIAAWSLVKREGSTVIQRLDFEITPVAAAVR
jgi:hypothetical protein